MLGGDLRVAFADRKRLRRLQEPLEAIGEFLEIHRCFPLHHADSEGMAGKGKLMPRGGANANSSTLLNGHIASALTHKKGKAIDRAQSRSPLTPRNRHS